MIGGGAGLDFLLNKIEEDVEYLYLQGKRVDKIKMNPAIYEHFITLKQGASTKDIPVEADGNVEKYELIYSEIH